MPKNVVQYDLLISCPGDITTEISIAILKIPVNNHQQ